MDYLGLSSATLKLISETSAALSRLRSVSEDMKELSNQLQVLQISLSRLSNLMEASPDTDSSGVRDAWKPILERLVEETEKIAETVRGVQNSLNDRSWRRRVRVRLGSALDAEKIQEYRRKLSGHIASIHLVQEDFNMDQVVATRRGVENLSNRVLELRPRHKTPAWKQGFELFFSLDNVPLAQHFTGREEFLEVLCRELIPSNPKQRKVVVLHGLGGIGKTQLAVNFARTHQAKFSSVFFIDANSQASVLKCFDSIYKRITVDDNVIAEETTGAQPLDSEWVAREVLKWFSLDGNDRWLLIFDNVDRAPDDEGGVDIMAYFPPRDQGSILVTSRLASMPLNAMKIPVDPMNEYQSAALLDRFVTMNSIYQHSSDAKTKLLQMLDGLPLAISQAGRFVKSSKMGLDEYLSLYESSKHEVIEKLPFATDGIEDTQRASIRTTWTISVNLLKQRMEKDTIDGNHYNAFHLLQLLAYFEPTDLSFDIMEKGLIGNQIPDWFRQVFSSKLQFYTTIQILLDLSLLDKQTNGTSYSMHRVVHDWLCTYMAGETDMQLLSLAMNAIAFSAPAIFRVSTWATEQRRLISHVDFLLPRLRHLKSSIPLVEFHKLDEKDLDKISEVLKPQRIDAVELFPNQPMWSICYLISAGGKVDEALAIMDSAMARLNDSHIDSPAKSQELIALTGVRAGLLFDKESYDEAKTAISVVLNGLPQLQLPQRLIRRHTIQTQCVLSLILYDSGSKESSVDLLASLLWECKELYGTFHSLTWLMIDNLDEKLSRLERHADRQSILEKFKLEAETAFDHEENARSALRWLADAKRCNNFGDCAAFKEAEMLYQRVLAWKLKSQERDDFAVGEIWSDLSMLYQKWGREEMGTCGLEWLRICRLHRGEQHEDTGWAYNDLAGIYQQLGNHTEAIPMYKKAIEILPKDTKNYTKLCLDLSKALHAKQDKEAIEFGRKALAADILIFGMYHINTAENYCALGTYLRYHQMWQEAKECFEEAFNISRQISNLYYEELSLKGLRNVFSCLGDSNGYWGSEVALDEDLYIRCEVSVYSDQASEGS
ncbi:hypothetical protein N431DRAFT_556473 [Stipitochalara longipes BDJ]|nr:hypothetical protein N431DRAFT_556473 [Stipitochalara longipes BDJ]